MPDDWREAPLSALADLTGGYAFKSDDYAPAGRFVLRTLNIRNDGSISRDDAVYLPEELCPEYWRFELRPHDTLFVMVGATLGKVGYVRESDLPALLNQNMWLIRAKRGLGDPRFIQYAFRNSVKQSLAWASGSARDFVRRHDYRNLQIPSPPLAEQRAIASVLGALDDKIELNRRMNETLEALAQSLFKSWFVDTTRDGLPKGWRDGKVSELAMLNRESLNPGEFPDETFAHYSIPAFDEAQSPKSETGESIKSNKLVVPTGCVMVSKLNPRIPRVWLPELSEEYRAVCSTEFLVALPKSGVSCEFLFCLFKDETFVSVFATMVTGTSGSHQRVKPESLLGMETVIPPQPLIQKLTEAVTPMLKRISQNVSESRTLAALRDALLPKLLSGELRVKEAYGRG